MDVSLTKQDEQFRDEVRGSLEENLDAEVRRAGALASGLCGDHTQTKRWHNT